MSEPQNSEKTLRIQEARDRFLPLVREAEQGATTWIRDSETGAVAGIAPLPAEGQPQGRQVSVTDARAALGDLIRQVAAGEGVVLLKNRRPAAQLIGRADAAFTGLGDVLADVVAQAPANPTFGLAALDDATGGLIPGRFVLVAAPPGAGGSLLAVATARKTALHAAKPVLYAASGLRRADVAARIVAAEANVDYRHMRAGTLPDQDREAALKVASALSGAPLHVNDSRALTAEWISEAALAKDLGLVVVDRLQYAPDAGVPLSGPALPAAARVLAALARDQDVPVLAVMDSDDRQAVAAINADVTLTLARNGDHVDVTVAERDFGTVTTVPLLADFARARFADAPQRPAAPSAPAPAPATEESPHIASQGPVTAEENAAQPSEQPAESPMAREARAANQRYRAGRATKSADEAAQEMQSLLHEAVEEALSKAGGDTEAAMKKLERRAIPDAMALWTKIRTGGRYEHTAFPRLSELFRKASKKDSDEIWEARPKWTNRSYRRNPDGESHVTALDVNAAYLSALKCHLPIGKLEHSASGEYVKKRAGIHLITPPEWNHPDLPNPLGDREEPGPLWITTATLRLLLRLAAPDQEHRLLDAPPEIHESWTSGSTEVLLDGVRKVLSEARTKAIAEGDYVTLHYVKKMYSKLVSTMGESNNNRDLYRPDWMHNIRSQAFSNLYGRALKAHRGGLTVISVLGTDELHVIGDWRTVFNEGTGPADMKIKTLPRTGELVEYNVTRVSN
ncbi:DnaB-like helicase C-terminal domain-containing protein [Streptomyces xiamenensis]|uniref:DnaB-like helicase C-terminal domain-containing protein n=1 Tax=Streptomyces xiamenensis TaxID=408015 RepID=UPI0035DC28C5